MWKRLRERIRSDRLFRRESPTLTAWEVVGWWESRRVPYNLIVGIAGILSGLLCLLFGLISELKFGTEFGLPDPPLFALFGVILFAIAANVAYTGGWLTEIILNWLWKNPWPDYGPITLALGTTFSVLVALTPAVLTIALTVIQVFTGPLSSGGPE